MADIVKSYGWAAQPRDPSSLLGHRKNIRDPDPQLVASINLPDSSLATSALDYAKRELNTETFNHSMRVYYYGIITILLPLTVL